MTAPERHHPASPPRRPCRRIGPDVSSLRGRPHTVRPRDRRILGVLARVTLQPSPGVAYRVALAEQANKILVSLDAFHGRRQRRASRLPAPTAHRALPETTDVVAEEVVLQWPAPTDDVRHPMPDDADDGGVRTELRVAVQVKPSQLGKAAGNIRGTQGIQGLLPVAPRPGYELGRDTWLVLPRPSLADDCDQLVQRPTRQKPSMTSRGMRSPPSGRCAIGIMPEMPGMRCPTT